MQNKPPIKPPIPMILSAYKAASRFRNFAFCTLIFAFSTAALLMSRSLYTCRENSTNHPLFMQNEPNFHRGKNEPNPIYKKGLRKFYTPSHNEKRTQNEPKTNPICEKPKMNLNFYSTKDYENIPLPQAHENEPKTNPISTEPKNEPNPIYKKGLRNFYTPSDSGKRTQNEPNSNPISPPPNSPSIPITHPPQYAILP